MKDIIKLDSRYGNNYLKRLSDNPESKTYVLKTDYDVVRTGSTQEGKLFIDPSGGPMIVVGCILEEAGATVKSINFVKEVGYTITFD